MQYERLVALSNGTCIKIDNSLNSSVKSITFELEINKKYEDHITIYNTRELMIDGTAYSDNNRVTISNPFISGKTYELSFNINTQGLNDGDEIDGIISIITNVGYIKVPFKYSIIANNFVKAIKKIETITDYYDYFNENTENAIELFSDKAFLNAKFMQNERNLTLYNGLIKGSNVYIAIIEFFKAFEIDVVKFFAGIDDVVVSKYVDETLDNIDLSQIKDKARLEKILSLKKMKEEMAYDEVEAVREEAISLVQNLRDRELLNALASMCARNNYIDEIAFNIYSKVIEKGTNVSSIYDKFLLAMPEECNTRLPLYIYRYYYEDKSYSFDDKSKLYENIISVFSESEDVYKLYNQEMMEYAVSRIYQNKITESLVKIYTKVLCKEIINENNCNNVLYLLRSHKIIIKNKDIKRVILKYAETEKESKYDVINGICYVPIFFDSYILLYEDVFGNRYFTEDIAIRALFDRKDLESFIIDNFPQKDIIDMTKVIKLNELDSFTNEYEIEEASTLESTLKINRIIIDKYTSKTIDFYFNKIIEGSILGESVIQYLRKIPFTYLGELDKKKLLKVLLECQQYALCYDYVSIYGLDLMENDDLTKLFSHNIDINDVNKKQRFLTDLFIFTKTRHKDQKILNFLASNYDGSIENMIYILDSLSELGLDTSYIAKKILMICLECNVSENIDHVYDLFDTKLDDNKGIVVAYLNKKATDYMLDDVETDELYFKRLCLYLSENYNDIDTAPIIFLLAITKYISTFKMLSNNELRRILIKAMERLLKLDLVFSYYKKLNKHMKMPYYIMNKEYIEYHAAKDFVPKAILSISGVDEKKEVELSKVFMNIYVKRITVFKNEVINYEIINSNDPATGILAKGTLTYDENYEFEYARNSNMKSTFDYINDAIVCLDRDNVEGLKKVVVDMTEKQEISKLLFNI